MEQVFNRMGKIGGAFLLAGFGITRFFFVVDGGERGVIFDKFSGVKEKVYGEGMHFMLPIIQVSHTLVIISGPKNLRGQIKIPDDSF